MLRAKLDELRSGGPDDRGDGDGPANVVPLHGGKNRKKKNKKRDKKVRKSA